MPRILLVDDEEQIRGILAAFLAKTGFDVTQAPGGAQAVEFLKSGAPMDLMILDMKMPLVTGLDVLTEKSRLNDTRPVILLTGSMTREKTYADLKALGFRTNDIVYKPVDLFVILDMVKARLGMKA